VDAPSMGVFGHPLWKQHLEVGDLSNDGIWPDLDGRLRLSDAGTPDAEHPKLVGAYDVGAQTVTDHSGFSWGSVEAGKRIAEDLGMGLAISQVGRDRDVSRIEEAQQAQPA
jgi:hypothetical protein